MPERAAPAEDARAPVGDGRGRSPRVVAVDGHVTNSLNTRATNRPFNPGWVKYSDLAK